MLCPLLCLVPVIQAINQLQMLAIMPCVFHIYPTVKSCSHHTYRYSLTDVEISAQANLQWEAQMGLQCQNIML